MADIITAKVFKYDPSVDEAPYYETYEVEWDDSDPTGIMTALQVLLKINEEIAPVRYDHNCCSGLCGRCSMLIDGKPSLACWTRMTPGEHTFEPLPGFPVIRDLVVDRSKALRRIVDANLQIQTVDPIVNLPTIDYDLYWNTLERLNMCRECMCCYAVCPVKQGSDNADTYAGPAAMMAIAQRVLDTEDQSDRIGQAAFSGVFQCIQCGACQDVCPSGIRITELIAMMQQEAEARGLKPTSDVPRR